jgi:hypothetical protein
LSPHLVLASTTNEEKSTNTFSKQKKRRKEIKPINNHKAMSAKAMIDHNSLA